MSFATSRRVGYAAIATTVGLFTATLSVDLHAQAAAPLTLTIEPTARQQIEGWGAFPSYHNKRNWGASWSLVGQFAALQNTLLVDSGITVIRTNLEDSYYDPAQPNQLALNDAAGNPQGPMQDLIEILQVAKTKGIGDYIMSIWTPPAVFKTNGRGGNTELRPESEDAFVEFATNAVRYLRARSDLPRLKAFTFQNEPGFAAPYGGTLYKFDQYNRVGRKFAAAFAAKGINDLILIGGDAENPNNLSSLLIDPANASAVPQNWVDVVSVHSYDNALWNAEQRTLDTQGVAAQAARWGRDFWMTEWDMLHYGDWQWQSNRMNTKAFDAENTDPQVIPGWLSTGTAGAAFTQNNGAVGAAKARQIVHAAATNFSVSTVQTAKVLKDNWYRFSIRVRGGAQAVGTRGSWLELSGYDASNPAAITKLLLSGTDQPRDITSPDIQSTSGTVTLTLRTVGAANESLAVDDIVLYGHSELWASDRPFLPPSSGASVGPYPAITNGMDRAISYIRHFTRDMSALPYTHWFSWIMWKQDGDPKLQTHLEGPSDSFTTARPFKAITKIFNSVKPSEGFRVKRMAYASPLASNQVANELRDQNWSELDMVAFESATKTVVVLTNRFLTSKPFTVNGVLRGTSGKVFQMSDANADMAAAGVVSVANGAFNIALPARTITVIEIEGMVL